MGFIGPVAGTSFSLLEMLPKATRGAEAIMIAVKRVNKGWVKQKSKAKQRTERFNLLNLESEKRRLDPALLDSKMLPPQCPEMTNQLNSLNKRK